MLLDSILALLYINDPFQCQAIFSQALGQAEWSIASILCCHVLFSDVNIQAIACYAMKKLIIHQQTLILKAWSEPLSGRESEVDFVSSQNRCYRLISRRIITPPSAMRNTQEIGTGAQEGTKLAQHGHSISSTLEGFDCLIGHFRCRRWTAVLLRDRNSELTLQPAPSKREMNTLRSQQARQSHRQGGR